MLLWSIIWALSLLGATAALRFVIPQGSLLIWPIALLPLLVSVAAVRSYLLVIKFSDELSRKIEMEAMSVGYHAGIIFCVGYISLEAAGLPTPFFAFTAVVIIFSKTLYQMRAIWKYQ
jgi:hypothetical protein